jgi:hypothetical protein
MIALLFRTQVSPQAECWYVSGVTVPTAQRMPRCAMRVWMQAVGLLKRPNFLGLV